MMIPKVDICFLGGVQGKNLGFRGHFEVQTANLPVGSSQPRQTCQKGVFWCFATFLQILSRNIDRKILFENKIKISTR